MKTKKLNYNQILAKAGARYHQLKVEKNFAPDMVPTQIQSDQVKAAIYVIVEELNKVLETK